MEQDNFDNELFIDEVEKKTVIWDIESTDYSNRQLRRKAWEEIVEMFCNPADSDEKKKGYGILLQKKWKGFRDCFVRELKRIKNAPVGSEASSKAPYIYFQRLMFLERSIRNKQTDTIEDTPAEKLWIPLESSIKLQVTDEEVVRPSSNNRPKRKKKISDPEPEFVNINQKNIISPVPPQPQTSSIEYDDEKLFCLSLHKELLKVPEDRRLQTKIDLLSIIHRAQQIPGNTLSVNNLNNTSSVASAVSEPLLTYLEVLHDH